MSDLIPNLHRLLGVGRTVESRVWLKEGHWGHVFGGCILSQPLSVTGTLFPVRLENQFLPHSLPAILCQSETSEMEPRVEPPVLALLVFDVKVDNHREKAKKHPSCLSFQTRPYIPREVALTTSRKKLAICVCFMGHCFFPPLMPFLS